jgi:chemotaxis protein MotB
MKPYLPCLLVAACVSTGTYNKKVAELEKLRAQDAQLAKDRERTLQDEIDKTKKSYVELQTKLVDVQSALDQANAQKTALQQKVDLQLKKLDDDTQLVTTLKQRLEKLGQNVDGLVKERAQLAAAMQDTNARLEELRKQKAAADARAATYKSLTDKLRSMIDSGKLSVKIRKGRMLISLPNDVLFDSGSATIKKAGQDALAQVAQALSGFSDRQFLVAGHTDDRAIHTARFPSNWELSTARAVTVTRFLVSKGMKPEQLGALGYGEFDPVVPNDSEENRALNRRIEIQLQPNLSELPSMADLPASSG